MHAAPALSLRKAALVVAFAFCLLAFPAPAGAAVRVLADDELERAVTVKINDVRASRGLRRLVVRSALKKAATKHAANMALHGYFSHSWSTGASYGTWIRWYWPGPGYSSWSAGENLYWRSVNATAARVVSAWMNSPGHRANILGRWTSIGAGVVHAVDPTGVYHRSSSVDIVAAEFGRRS